MARIVSNCQRATGKKPFCCYKLQSGQISFCSDSWDSRRAFVQYDDIEGILDGGLENSISRVEKKESEIDINEIEELQYAYVISSQTLLINVASPMHYFYSTYLQQDARRLLLSHLLKNNNIFQNMNE